MDDLILVKTLCFEYKELLICLLANESYQSEQKKEAYGLLIKEYEKAVRLIQEKNPTGLGLELRTKRDLLLTEIQRLGKMTSSIKGFDSNKAFETLILEMKMAVVGESLKVQGTAPFVAGEKIEFRRSGDTLFSYPLNVPSAALTHGSGE